MRRGILALALLPVLLVLLVALALGLLQVDPVRQKVLDVALAQVNLSIRGSLAVERLEGHLPFSAVLVGVRLFDPLGNEVAGIDRVAVDVALGALANRTVRVDRARIEGVRGTVYGAPGDVLLGGALRPVEAATAPPEPQDEAGSEWSFDLPDVLLTGSVALDTAADAPGFRELSLAASLRYAGGVLAWDRLEARTRSINLPVEDVTLSTRGSLGEAGGRIEQFHLGAGSQEVRLHGDVVLSEPRSIALAIDRVHLDIDGLVAALARSTGRELPLRGWLDLVGRVDGPLSGLKVDLASDTSAGSVVLTGTAGLGDEGPVYDLALQARAFRPAGLVGSLDVPVTADVSARIRGEGNPLEVGRASATVSIDHLQGMERLPGSLDLQAVAMNGWVQASLQARGPGGQRGRADISLWKPPPGPVSARLALERIDVGTWAGLAGLAGYSGTITALDATIRAVIPPQGFPHGSVRMDLLARDLRSPDGTVSAVDARVDGRWEGRGLPNGTLAVRLRGLGASGVALARADVQATFTPTGGQPAGRVRLRALALKAGQISVASITALGDVVLRGNRPTGDLTARLEGLVVPGRAMNRLEVTARLDRTGRIALAATGSGDHARLALAGEARLPGGGRALSATVHRLRLVDGEYGLTLLPGGWIRLMPDRTLAVDGLRLGGPRTDGNEMNVSGSLQPATGALAAEVSASDLDIGQAVAWVTRLTGQSPDPDIRLDKDHPPPEGKASLHAVVTGTLARPSATVDFAVHDVRFRGVSGLQAQGSASLEPGGVSLAASAATPSGGRLNVEATVPVEVAFGSIKVKALRDQPLRVAATLDDVDLAELKPLFGIPVQGLAGRVQGTVLLEGTLDDPRGQAALSLTDGEFVSMKDIRGRVDVTTTAERTQAVLDLSFNRDQVLRVEAEAPVNVSQLLKLPQDGPRSDQRLAGKPLRVAVAMRGVRPMDLPMLSHLGGGLLSRAILSADLLVTGSIGRPQLSGWLKAQGLLLGFEPADLALDVEPGEAATAVRVRLTRSETQWELATASVDLPGGLAAFVQGRSGIEALQRNEGTRFRLATARLPMVMVGKVSPALGRGVVSLVSQGVLTALVEAQGGAKGLAGHAELNIEPPDEPPKDQRSLARSVRLSADIQPGRTLLDGEILQGEGGGALTLAAEAGIGTTLLFAGGDVAPFPITGQFTARGFQLKELTTVMPSVFGPCEGVLEADVRVAGTSGTPRVSGNLRAAFADLSIAAAGLRQKNVTVAVDIDGRGIRLTPIHLADKGGTLDLDLAIGLASMKPQDMTIEGRLAMKRFRLLDRGDAKVRLTGDIALAGTVARPGIRGALKVDDATISPDIGGRKVHGTGMPENVVFINPGGQEAIAEAPVEAPSAPVDIDLTIDAPMRSLRIRNDMVDAFLGANLTIRTKEDKPSVEGTVTVAKGTLRIYGRELALAPDSTVVFDGRTEVDPRLQIKAEYSIKDVDLSPIGQTADRDSRIIVDVSGTASRPVLKMTSDPQMAETDIVSIIAMGSPVGAAPGQKSSVVSQTTNLVAGLATGTLSRLLKTQLPIDVFQVDQEFGEEAGTQITVGKRITRDLMVLYKANLGSALKEQNRNEVSIEYDVTRFLELQTGYGDAGQGALNLYLRWRY